MLSIGAIEQTVNIPDIDPSLLPTDYPSNMTQLFKSGVGMPRKRLITGRTFNKISLMQTIKAAC
jgi:hypothetical protein